MNGLTAEGKAWPCDDYKPPLTCWTTSRPKTVICEGCRSAFPQGPEVQRIVAARVAAVEAERDRLAAGVRALADEWDEPFSVHHRGPRQDCRTAAARALRSLLGAPETTGGEA